jgi:hypothetical protein
LFALQWAKHKGDMLGSGPPAAASPGTEGETSFPRTSLPTTPGGTGDSKTGPATGPNLPLNPPTTGPTPPPAAESSTPSLTPPATPPASPPAETPPATPPAGPIGEERPPGK